MTTVDLIDRAEWLARRRTGIGGSDVAGILGLSPWESPWSIWTDKVGIAPLDERPNQAQEFGKRAEPMLQAWFEDRTGLKVHGTQAEYTDPDRPWMRVTLDGEAFVPDTDGSICPHLDERVAVVEFKATSEPAGTWDIAVPVMYQCQAQWAMAITGATRCAFGVLHIAFGRPEFHVYWFDRDDEDIATIIEACDRFWHDHVLTGIPPEADAHDATRTAISDAYDRPTEETVAADDDLTGRVQRIVRLKADIAAIEVELAEHENTIRAALGNATVLAAPDTEGRLTVIATWRPQERHTLDTKAIRAHAPEIAEQYTRTTTSRVLLVKKPKNAA